MDGPTIPGSSLAQMEDTPIKGSVDEAAKRNQESMFADEQTARQERKVNVEGHQNRVEETHPLRSGEVSEIGEMWKEIQMLRQWLGSRAPTPKRENPFSLAILEEGLPPNFRQSNVGDYDGHTDPKEHLGRFENAAMLHQYSDGVRCRVFLGTLMRFASSKKHQKNYLSLFVVKQQEAETLREFVQRFNNAALEIPAATPDIMTSVFTQGLREIEFFKSLVKKPPSSYDDLLSRAEKYVNLEDAQRHKRMKQWPGGIRFEGAERGGRKRGEGEREDDKARGRGLLSSHVPLDGSRDKVMEVREPDGRWEKSQRRIEEQRGKGRGQDIPQEPVEPRRRMNEDNHHTRGMIHMISGDATDGDSGRARKTHGRRLENFEISRGGDLPQDPVISFVPEDLRGIVTPHNDALMVTDTISNYDVVMIFIDNQSSINVLFKSTLDQMKVEDSSLIRSPPRCMGLQDTPSRLWVTKMIAFTMVDTPSAHNEILGRPALNDFRALASTCHQKLKFPVRKGVGVLCGDQKVECRCYEGVVREEGKECAWRLT
ncbi:uncharacterized protein [Primulina eburnea]|uniref:uncharacterized protein n=1 Tax=Primulina eburnea TaxID=1245227 RepID=UPI003C6BF233